MSVNLDPAALEQLQHRHAKQLLDAVDSLRAAGVDKLVSLPQIIVCGDQSSGKSSVLEAISRVPFPTKAKLCTKFATELVMRQSPHINSRVCIKPSHSRTESEKERLRAFAQDFTEPEQFPSLIENAGSLMQDVSGDATSTGFFDDVLCVEVAGPDQPHLTIIDLPGFIHAANQEQTRDDIQIVENLVTSYMKNTRCIILAVVAANNNYANQVVLRHAQTYDPAGNRTMGILTKPDLIEAGSDDETALMPLVENKIPAYRFAYGWHVLRNRTHASKTVSSTERDTLEAEYLTSSIWSDHLPGSSLGVASLRSRLSGVSLDKIRSDLPAVFQKIQTERTRCNSDLKLLGNPRSTTKEYQLYLITITSQINRLAIEATNGTYSSSPDFFNDSDDDVRRRKKLRAVIRKLNIVFAQIMRKFGHENELHDGFFPATDAHPDTRLESMRQMLQLELPRKISSQDYRNEIEALDEEDRAFEPEGTVNPRIIYPLFEKLTLKWKQVAEKHLEFTYWAVMGFLDQVLGHATDETVADGLRIECIQPFMEDRRKAMAMKLDEILLPYQSGHVLSYSSLLLNGTSSTSSVFGHVNGATSAQAPVNGTSGLSVAQNRQYEQYNSILRLVRAYYDVALNTFIDNVACLIVENCLMRPLANIIDTDVILRNWDDKTLEDVCGEPFHVREKRRHLQQKQKILDEGLRVCERHISRGSSMVGPSINPNDYLHTGDDLASAFESKLNFDPPNSQRGAKNSSSSANAMNARLRTPPRFGSHTIAFVSQPTTASPQPESSLSTPATSIASSSPNRCEATDTDTQMCPGLTGDRTPYVVKEQWNGVSSSCIFETDPVYIADLSKSFEELRLEDYKAGKTTAARSTQPSNLFSGFGTPSSSNAPPPPAWRGLFDAPDGGDL